jgi:TP901 family phage tail tape measure protein
MAGDTRRLKVVIAGDGKGAQQAFAEVDGSAEKSGNKFALFGKIAGAALASAGVALGAFAVKGVKDAAALDKQMREVNTLFGKAGVEGERNFRQISKTVRDLSNDVGLAQSTIADGLYQAISAGVPKDNAFTFMQVASKAAIAGVTDVKTAVDGITTNINAFGLKAADAQRVADSMFTTVKGGKTTFGELASAMSSVAPIAAASKVRLEEVNAALATLTAGGASTSEAATQIRAALSGLQKPSADLDSIFQRLGFSGAQAALEGRGLGFALDAVKDATGGNNGELQKLLGSVEAVSAANVIAGTGARKFSDEMTNQQAAAGATDKAFSEMQQSVSVKWERLKVQLQNIGIVLGQKVLPMISDAIDVVTKAMEEAGPKFASIVDWFRRAGEDGEGLSTKFQDLRTKATETFEQLASTIRTIFDALKLYWDTFGANITQFFADTWDNILTVIDGALKIIEGVVKVFTGILTGDWSKAWDGIKDILSGAWDIIKGLLGQAFDMLKLAFRNGMDAAKALFGKAWDSMKQAAKEKISSLMSSVKELPGKIKDVFSNAGSWLKDAGRWVIEGLVSGIHGALSSALSKVREAASKIKNAAKNALGINSPSTVFRDEVGKWIPAGIAEGIARNSGVVDAEVRNLGSPSSMGGGSMASAALGGAGTSRAAAGAVTIAPGAVVVHIAGDASGLTGSDVATEVRRAMSEVVKEIRAGRR